MVKYLIQRPVAVVVTFVAICAIGLIASQQLPISMLPDIKIPEITVQITQENTNAYDLERSIISSMRSQLIQVPGLSDIQSETRDNTSQIRLKFDYGINIDYAFIEVNDKVDAAMAKLPREVRRPKIIKASTTDLPVFFLNISLKDSASISNSKRFSEMCELGSNVISKRLEQLPEVAVVDISGILKYELYVVPDELKMQSLNLSADVLRSALDQNNISVGGITVREGLLQYNLVFRNELRTIQDVRGILISANGNTVKLGDIAAVGIRQQTSQGIYLSQSKPAICLALIKSSDARINKMKEEVGILIENFKRDYPEINFEISQDQTFLLNYSIDNLRQNLLQGCFLAILVMFLFIRDFRSPILIAITLPVTLTLSLLFFYLFGISINIVSLSGLILGVGMMIDNSIVVIDNILQHHERGSPLGTAIINGTNEVIAPMVSSTLTSCAIFIPLIFLSGIAGALFYDQAMAIAIGQGASLLVSITLTPVIFNLSHKSGAKSRKIKILEKISFFDMERSYVKWLNVIFKFKRITFWGLILLMAIGVLLFIKIDKRQLPDLPQNETICQIDWNQAIHVDENRIRVERMLAKVEKHIVQSNAFIGEQQFILNQDIDLSTNESQVYFKSRSPGELVQLKKIFSETMRTEFPEADFSFGNPDNPFMKIFSSEEEQLVVRISSANRGELPSLSAIQTLNIELKKSLNGIEGNVPTRLQCMISLKPELLSLYQVNPEDVFTTLKVALNSYNIGTLKSDDRMLPIVIGAKPKLLNDILSTTFVNNIDGTKIPLRTLISIENKDDYRTIYGGKEGIYVPLPLKVSFSETQKIIDKVKLVTAKQSGLEASFSGSWFKNKKLLSEMAVILLISILLLFFILAAQFESLTTPLIVLIELPLDLAFAIVILYIAGNSINIMSLIGFIVMGGIIINDSILKIDTINQLQKEGLSIIDAIHEGGRRRLKPIIMTALTTVIALVPQMFGSDIGAKLQLPLSLSMLGGMTAGTAISLFVIPLAYYYAVKGRERFSEYFSRGKRFNNLLK